jgi:YggT family protein
MLLDAVSEIQLFVWVFGSVYAIVLIAYILTSWIRLPYSLQPVQRFLYDVCDPYLRLWRRILPFAVGAFDFSPMVAIIALYAAVAIVNVILNRI